MARSIMFWSKQARTRAPDETSGARFIRRPLRGPRRRRGGALRRPSVLGPDLAGRIVQFCDFTKEESTDLDEYRITNRGGKGVKTINITEKTGKLISIQAVTDDNDLMIINRSGLTIRTAVSQIRLAGRATQGVRIINLREGDAIASVMAVPAAGEEEEVPPAVTELI